jgi:hypothetical protein
MSDRRNRLLDKSISGDSVLFGQVLDFKNDIEPFVKEKQENLLQKIGTIQQTFNGLERQIVEATLERERQEEQNRMLRKKSTSRLNHDYKSKLTIELADNVAECEEHLEKLTSEEKQQKQTLL